MPIEHVDIAIGEIHVPYNWSYATAAARTGATGLVAGDVGKFARQIDNNTIWMLTATTPVWVLIGGVDGTESAFGPAFTTLTDGATVTWDAQSKRVVNAKVTLGGNRTLSITNLVSGASGCLLVVQDATGGRTLTLPAGSKVVEGGAGAITLSTGANKNDFLSWIYDGTNLFWTYGKNFT